MFNEIILVSITPFSGTTDADKNGENPVMLQLVAGKMPNRNVLSGTIAKRLGVEVGKTYLMNVRESGEDVDFGKDYTFVKMKELDEAKDIVATSKELGAPEIISIPRPEGYGMNVYERKTNAVEGLRTIRTKEGKYKPASNSNLVHNTASKVLNENAQKAEIELNDILNKQKGVHVGA